MKTVIAVLLAAVLGFGAAYYYLSRNHAKRASAAAVEESNWANEKAYLEQQLAEARRRAPDVRTVTRTTTVTNQQSPDEILARLARLNPQTSEESRNHVLRQVVYNLQLLASIGDEALPVIHEFLKQNRDMDYSVDVLNAAGERVGSAAASAWASRNVALTDFLVPPSLRLGLIDVLDQIGGEKAQGILAEVLDTTGRGVEVAHIARVLQREAPGKYRDNALKAAKELLANPPPIEQPNRIDDNARAYLYQVLAMHNDTSFAPTAQTLLVTTNGHLDKQALNYLNSTLKEQAVPALYSAYKDPKLTDAAARTSLMNAVLSYAGPSAQANQLFTEVAITEDIPPGVRVFTIRGLAGAPGAERPGDPNVLQTRINLLAELRGRSTDERILRAIDDTKSTLEQMLATSKGRN
jgi:hypothetical protein